MTPQEKLERAKQLIAAQAEIEAELLELMGAEEEAEEEEPAPTKRQYKKRGPKPSTKGCAECGSPSKHKSFCSKSKAKPQKLFTPTEETTPVGITRSNGRTILDKPLQLTATEYAEVCEQFGEGLTIEMIAFNYPHVEIAEIRKASISDNYRDYQAM